MRLCAVDGVCNVACYHPMPAVRMVDGSVKFVSRSHKGVADSLELPCGQCIGCRLERSRQWAMRCMHEASLHDVNSFVTLTYDDEHVPQNGSLRYRDFQLFMKRLRKTRGKVSFYCGGEYGETTRRPHFHACLFGVGFADRQYLTKGADGSNLYTSAELDRLWSHGFCTVGSVCFASAAYIARYCVAKVNGPLAKSHYTVIDADGVMTELEPEFNHMSLKPAVGKRWLERYMTDVFPRDYVIVNGVKVKPPKYYDRIFESLDPERFSDIVAQRELDAYRWRDDNSYERLKVKETVHKARSSQLIRSL